MVFKALFPGILSGIQGLKQRQALNGIVAPLNGISGTLAETGPEWYYGPFSGISSGIQGALSWDSKRYSGPEWY